MSTLQPRPPYSDAELAELYPSSLELQLVQILLRHGERTPVTPRFQDTTGLPAFWPYCAAARHLRSAVLDPDSGTFSHLQWQRRLETFANRDEPALAVGARGEVDAVCDMGMLTDRGRETTTLLGRRLRHLYVDRLGFLPPSLTPTTSDSLYLRSTPIPRALESLQQTIHGLYPPHTRDAATPPLTILSRTPGDETLFPNEGNCRRFAALARAFAQRAAERWNGHEDMAFLTRKLGRYMPSADGGDAPGVVAVDGRPRLSGLMDTINATAAHGPDTKLPRDFYDPKVKQIVEKIGVEEWYAGYTESQEYRTLGIGGLLGDVVARMARSIQSGPSTADGDFRGQGRAGSSAAGSGGGVGGDPASVRFGLSGCHDTTLAGVLASLGAYNTDAWPPFTSHIAIELFRHADSPASKSSSSSSAASSVSSWLPSIFGGGGSSKRSPHSIGKKPTSSLSDKEKKQLEGYYVRIRYNDNPVTIPGCKTPGNHLDGNESFCTLAAFKSIVDKFTPVDWRTQCRANIGESAFPSKPEPAGH